MIRIPKPNPIEFLVSRKFPNAKKLKKAHVIAPSPGRSTIDSNFLEEQRKKIKEYESDLRALEHSALIKLFKSEQEAHRKEMMLKAEEEERNCFFNQSTSNADYDHWCKATYWTLDEAIALSFGKDPEQVNWGKLKDYHPYTPSPFVEKYRKKRDLAVRAKNFNQLYAPILPGPFLAWAKRTGIDVVSELFEGIEAQGVVIADWKDQYDNLQIQHDQLQQQFDTLAQQHEGLIQEISDINAAIHNRSSSLSGSQYWQKFEALAVKAVSEFPNWVKTQGKIQKTGNLLTWLTSSIGADNREADLIKKILSDFFSELK